MSTPLDRATRAAYGAVRAKQAKQILDVGGCHPAPTNEMMSAIVVAVLDAVAEPVCLWCNHAGCVRCGGRGHDRRIGPADRRDPTKNTHTARVQQRMNHGRRSTDKDTP